RRRTLLLCAASFVAFSAWELLRPAHPYVDLSRGHFTDHFSHLNAARLFTRFGARIWTVPLDKTLKRATPAERRAMPRDVNCTPDCVFVMPGWSKPVTQNWPHVVRYTPLGALALVAPLAALYHFTPLSFTMTNRLLLVLFLFFAHLGLFVLLDGLWSLPEPLCSAAFLPGLIGANEILHWTLEGFYDAILVAPLLLCWRFLGQRRGLWAITAYCVAAFFH